MQAKTGTLSIHSENIFPIIKKALYSNEEVFLRELVSNAADACQKLSTLIDKGVATVGDFAPEVSIAIDEDARTLTVTDNGIGMTADEVERYIAQIAFSSAEDFVKEYKDADDKIIGHFGLGFYSAFMVADKVDVITRSYQEGAEPMKWSSTGATEYTMESAEREQQGTDIVLHLSKEADEYLQSVRIKEILSKYGKFLPVPVKFESEQINNTQPAWIKTPSDLTDEDYRNFYREIYPMAEMPLFWIHLNVDYPFRLKGILYFPPIRPQMDVKKNKIQLYQQQVFVTDHVEDIVPEYLTLLHGVIDSQDIPLNVSRSYLQTDATVKKISQHIAKKVADKLKEIYKEDREAYNKQWDSIGVFLKFGLMSDDKFKDRAMDLLLLKNTEKELFTVDEYKEKIREKQLDKDDKLVMLYATDPDAQDSYIHAAQQKGYDVLLFDHVLDMNFVSWFEMQLENVEIKRVDADVVGKLIDKGIDAGEGLNKEEQDSLRELFKEIIDNQLVAIKFENIGTEDLPVTITRPEHQRRMQDMASLGIMGSASMPDMFNVILNESHPKMKSLLLKSGDEQKQTATHLYELAMLQQQMLSGRKLTEFIQRNLELV